VVDAKDVEIAVLKTRVETLTEAIMVAKTELERRLEGMNEFRAQLDSQTKSFVTREMMSSTIDKIDLKTAQLDEKIASVQNDLSKSAGSSKWSDHIVTVLIGAAVVLAVWLIQGTR
jgi:chromosome segregation ATPase